MKARLFLQMFFFDRAGEEVLHRFARVESFVDDGVSGLCDGNRDVVFDAELMSGNARVDPFDGHADFLARPFGRQPFGNESSVTVIAAVARHASDAEIAHAG